jgi:hypothetical protein
MGETRVVVALEEYGGVVVSAVRPSPADARSFAAGFEACAEQEGNDYKVFVLPDDESALRADEEIDEEHVESALAAAAEALEHARLAAEHD